MYVAKEGKVVLDNIWIVASIKLLTIVHTVLSTQQNLSPKDLRIIKYDTYQLCIERIILGTLQSFICFVYNLQVKRQRFCDWSDNCSYSSTIIVFYCVRGISGFLQKKPVWIQRYSPTLLYRYLHVYGNFKFYSVFIHNHLLGTFNRTESVYLLSFGNFVKFDS